MSANAETGSNFNRHWYANNNPYRFTDPDGRFAASKIESTCESYDMTAVYTFFRSAEDARSAVEKTVPEGTHPSAITYNNLPPKTVPTSGENERAMQCVADCTNAGSL